MPVIIRRGSVQAERKAAGVLFEALVTPETVKSDAARMGRWRLDPGSAAELSVPGENIAWIQILQGEGRLTGSEGEHDLTNVNVAFLPPGFQGAFESPNGAAFLLAEIPDAARFDPQIAANPPSFRLIDWTTEPALKSEHDGRMRVYIVTPKLLGTKAAKGEMIFYPAGEACPNHHHTGAEHFFYVLQGGGTYYSDGTPMKMGAGDVVYSHPSEKHYFINDGKEELIFAEFFVPSQNVTVWENPDKACAWLPTGKNIKGGVPVRQIKAHSSALVEVPEDV
ncbi:MAG: cupin domain-containing protein [bacterium]